MLAAGGQCAGGKGAGAGEEHITGQAGLQTGRVGKAGLPPPTAQTLVGQRSLQALLRRLLLRQGRARRAVMAWPVATNITGFFLSWTSMVLTHSASISASFLDKSTPIFPWGYLLLHLQPTWS